MTATVGALTSSMASMTREKEQAGCTRDVDVRNRGLSSTAGVSIVFTESWGGGRFGDSGQDRGRIDDGLIVRSNYHCIICKG